MATIALTIGGALLAPTLVGTSTGLAAIAITAGTVATAATIGATIDGMFIYPAIVGTQHLPDQEGPRLEETALGYASEGSPANFSLGPRNRTGGACIFCSNLFEDKDVEKYQAGKNSTGKIITYDYTVDFAFALCTGRPINKLTRIYANGRVIWEAAYPIDFTSTAISCEFYPMFADADGDVHDNFVPVQRIISPLGGQDLTQVEGGLLKVTGFTNPQNNSTIGRFVLGVGTLDNGSTYVDLWAWTLYGSPSDEAAGNSIQVIQATSDWEIFVERTMGPVKIYKGEFDQDASSYMPPFGALLPGIAYRGTAYIFIKQFRLEDWGNAIPQFSFEYEADESMTVSDALGILLQRGGLDSAEYDTSQLNSDVIQGYSVPGLKSTLQALDPIMRRFDLIAREEDGVVVFLNRGDENEFTIDADLLAARLEGSNAHRRLPVVDYSNNTLPSEVCVQYLGTDPEYDLQRASQRERNPLAIQETVMSVDVPMAMSKAEARAIAQRELKDAWSHRRTVEITLPPRYMDIREQDILHIDDEGTNWTIRVMEIKRGHNMLLTIKGVVQDVSLYEWTPPVDGGDVESPNQLIHMFPALFLGIMEIAPLSQVEVGRIGFYVSATRTDPLVHYEGANLLKSTEDDISQVLEDYVRVGPISREADGGVAETVLADGTEGWWDRDNTVTVRMWEGSLDSVTEYEVLQGKNWAMLGSEVIGFANATLDSTDDQGIRTYTLDTILRGLRFTGTPTHYQYERFIPLYTMNVQFIDLERKDLNIGRYWRALARGSSGEYDSPIRRVMTGKSVRQPAPSALRFYTTDTSITFSWKRRTLEPYPMFTGQPFPEPPNVPRQITDGGGNVLANNGEGVFEIKMWQENFGSWNPAPIEAQLTWNRETYLITWGSITNLNYHYTTHEWHFAVREMGMLGPGPWSEIIIPSTTDLLS